MMNRRLFLLTSVGALVCAPPAFAAVAPEDEVARNLTGAGFRITSRRRTMLGRVRFLAVRGSTEREVVLDPSSGEILRDYSRASSGGERSEAPGRGTEGSGDHSGGGEGEGEGEGESEGESEREHSQDGVSSTREGTSEPPRERSGHRTTDEPQ